MATQERNKESYLGAQERGQREYKGKEKRERKIEEGNCEIGYAMDRSLIDHIIIIINRIMLCYNCPRLSMIISVMCLMT